MVQCVICGSTLSYKPVLGKDAHPYENVRRPRSLLKNSVIADKVAGMFLAVHTPQ